MYEGEFKSGKRQGFGVYMFPSGSPFERYEGMWAEGLPNGQGTRIFRSGEKYVGEFVNWSQTGNGEKFSAEGRSLQKGKWREDQFLG